LQTLIHQQAAEKRDLVERIATMQGQQRQQRRDLLRRVLVFTKVLGRERSRDELHLDR